MHTVMHKRILKWDMARYKPLLALILQESTSSVSILHCISSPIFKPDYCVVLH